MIKRDRPATTGQLVASVVYCLFMNTLFWSLSAEIMGSFFRATDNVTKASCGLLVTYLAFASWTSACLLIGDIRSRLD